MKKIGTLAFFHPNTKNYGAILQSFALSKTIQQLGYDAELIDVRDIPKKRKFLSSVKKKIKGAIEGNPFRTFLKSQVSLSKPLYTLAELEENAKQYHAVVVGSDQVWRPEYCGNQALNYFLDFVPEGVKRISYAASFGVDKWNVDALTTVKIKKEVVKFNTVTVRESAGINICKEVFGVNAAHVLDPTLLADKNLFLDLLPKPKLQQPYIASFVLDITDETAAIAAYISKQTNNPIQWLNKREMTTMGFNWDKFLTIKEWLVKLRDADMVITDSFHCVCFSLIFQKQFICVGNPARGLSRLNSLLQIVGLENRFFFGFEEVKSAHVWDTKIDYKEVNKRLEVQRQISLKTLKDSLV